MYKVIVRRNNGDDFGHIVLRGEVPTVTRCTEEEKPPARLTRQQAEAVANSFNSNENCNGLDFEAVEIQE